MKSMKSTSQARYDLRYHFVWIPKYRKRVLTGKIAKSIEGMIRFVAQINDWDIYELAIQKDHIHLYMGAQPKWSPSSMVQRIKGGTSKKIRELYPDLDEVYWENQFWTDGYMVKSVGEITDKVVSQYVKNQKGS